MEKKARLLVSSNIKEPFNSVLHIYFKMIPDYSDRNSISSYKQHTYTLTHSHSLALNNYSCCVNQQTMTYRII